MDQDAFRNLLTTSRPQGVPTPASNTRPKTTNSASEPAFKPRKVKKTESKYRDRAAERREGTGNDYAQVEAVLEDFERRVANEDKNVIEQQRKYLGGDIHHTVLVKGLDMSLLEQGRVRASASGEDDETLEQAFTEAGSTSEPRKRTREDIIRDLKANRQRLSSVDRPAVENESVLKAGKFRPIGFKPVEEKPRKRKGKEKEKEEGVKKKQKKEKERVEVQIGTRDEPDVVCEPESEPEPEAVDIFAGTGEYEGLPNEEDETQRAISPALAVPSRGWFDEPEPEKLSPVLPEETLPIPEMAGEIRLQPLESSLIPSIPDFLAVDENAEKAEKRRARKEKKKKKKKAEDEDD